MNSNGNLLNNVFLTVFPRADTTIMKGLTHDTTMPKTR